MKAEAEVLLTWNTRDFIRFGPEVANIVKTPDDYVSVVTSSQS